MGGGGSGGEVWANPTQTPTSLNFFLHFNKNFKSSFTFTLTPHQPPPPPPPPPDFFNTKTLILLTHPPWPDTRENARNTIEVFVKIQKKKKLGGGGGGPGVGLGGGGAGGGQGGCERRIEVFVKIQKKNGGGGGGSGGEVGANPTQTPTSPTSLNFFLHFNKNFKSSFTFTLTPPPPHQPHPPDFFNTKTLILLTHPP